MFDMADARTQGLVGLVKRYKEDPDFRGKLRNSYEKRLRVVRSVMSQVPKTVMDFEREEEEEAALKEAFFRALAEKYREERDIDNFDILQLRGESSQVSYSGDRSWDPVLIAESYPDFVEYFPEDGLADEDIVRHFGLTMYDNLASTGSDYREYRKLNNYKGKIPPESSPWHDAMLDSGVDPRNVDGDPNLSKVGRLQPGGEVETPAAPVDFKSFQYEDSLLDPSRADESGVSELMASFFDYVCRVSGPRFATYLITKMQWGLGYSEILRTYVPDLSETKLNRFRRDLDRKEVKFWETFREGCKNDPALRKLASDCWAELSLDGDSNPASRAPLVPHHAEVYREEAKRRGMRIASRKRFVQELKSHFDFVSVHRVGGGRAIEVCPDLDDLLPQGKFRETRLGPLYGFWGSDIEEVMAGEIRDVEARLRGTSRYVDVVTALELVKPEKHDVSLLVARSVRVA